MKRYRLLNNINTPQTLILVGAIFEQKCSEPDCAYTFENYTLHPKYVEDNPNWFSEVLAPLPTVKENYIVRVIEQTGFSFYNNSYDLNVRISHKVADDKFPAIKLLIERFLNNEFRVHSDYSWSINSENKKVFIQSEVDAIREESFNSARMDIGNINVKPRPMYATFKDYQDSLPADAAFIKNIVEKYGHDPTSASLNTESDLKGKWEQLCIGIDYHNNWLKENIPNPILIPYLTFEEYKKIHSPKAHITYAVNKNTFEIIETTHALDEPYDWVTFSSKELAENWIEENKYKGCGVCGGALVLIRGKYPGCDKREVCPTCNTERLEQISEIANKDYGKSCQA